MKNLIKVLLSLRRMIQFISVGIIGATCETIIIAILTVSETANPLVAKVIGVEVSISLMFLINDEYTFSDSGIPQLKYRIYRWIRSHTVRSGGIAVAFFILWLLTTQFDTKILFREADLWPTIANIIGIACALLINYIAESLFTWEIHK